MSWKNAKAFRKHNKKSVGRKGDKAAKMATDILKKTGDEGEAIATANKFLSRQRGHNSPALGAHPVKGFGGGMGHRGPRPGDHGPRAARGMGMHRFGSLGGKPGGGLMNR